jgi:3'-phosphoadenosine 5'-phosphosulfate sulfotransferase (PAPS reductase)/FAD synthetase
MPVSDNEMSDHQRIKALETIIAKLRKDLERVEQMLRLTPMKPRLKKQKGGREGTFHGARRDQQAAEEGGSMKRDGLVRFRLTGLSEHRTS